MASVCIGECMYRSHLEKWVYLRPCLHRPHSTPQAGPGPSLLPFPATSPLKQHLPLSAHKKVKDQVSSGHPEHEANSDTHSSYRSQEPAQISQIRCKYWFQISINTAMKTWLRPNLLWVKWLYTFLWLLLAMAMIAMTKTSLPDSWCRTNFTIMGDI